MALSSLRLRRAVLLSSSLMRNQRPFSAVFVISGSPCPSSVTVTPQNPRINLIQPRQHLLPFQARHFRSSSIWHSSARTSFRNNNNNTDEIGPDTILFEGCDYNHWLITIDFPKDPAPTREEMIETYLQTLAKVVGSYEEAKKRMYAFSTTTYQGFQCLVTEEMSEKFKGLPGVVFVLPDSYIDPVNKEYGGDKYDNGVITPRPPPPQYGRQGGRYGDRNRDFNRNRPMPNQQGNPSFGNQVPMYGDTRNFGPKQNAPMYGDTRNFGQQQNSPMQPNYGPTGAGDRRDPTPMYNAPGGRDPMPSHQATYSQNRRDPMPMNNAPGGRDAMPSHQATYSQNERGYYNPQGGNILPEQRDYVPPGQRHIRTDNMNHAPQQGVTYGQGASGNYGQMDGENYRQRAGGNYGQVPGGNYGQGASGNYGQVPGGNYGQGASGNYGQVPGENYGQGASGNYRQVPGGNYGQMEGGNFGQGAGGGYGQGAGGSYGQGVGAAYRQEMGSGNGQGYPGHGEDNRFSQVEQRNNTQGEQRNYAAPTHTGSDQVRH